MTEQPLSINALASALGRDRRTLSKALKLFPPDDWTSSGDKLFCRSTAERALDAAAGAALSGGSDEAVLAAVEDTASEMINALARLKHEPDVSKRRQMVFDGLGQTIGRFNDALQRSLETSHNLTVDQIVVDFMVGRSIGHLLHLCDWKLAPNDDWVPKEAEKTQRYKKG
jgi:hypothetical protein